MPLDPSHGYPPTPAALLYVDFTLVGGRYLVGDRIVAQYVFSQGGSRAERENIYSLSTRRDLLSQAIEQVLETGDAALPSSART